MNKNVAKAWGSMGLNRLRDLDGFSKVFLVFLAVAVVSIFWTTPLFLMLIAFFPAIFFFKIHKGNFLAVLPLLVLVSTSLFIVSAVILELIGAPVSAPALAIFNLLLTSSAFYALKRGYFRQVDFKVKDQRLIYSLYGIFLLAVVARVVSTFGVEIPILHDPIHHAFSAKEIATNQAIDYFYPPGLHVLTAFFAESLNINHALATHYMSNLLNAFSVLSWSIVAYFITKNRVFSLLVAFFMFIAPFPAVLYFMSGKNAFLASVAYIPIVFLFLYRFLKKTNWLSALLLAVSLLAIFFIHYPTFGYVIVFTGIILVAAGINKILSKENYSKYLVYMLCLVFAIAAISVSWLLVTKDSYTERLENRVQLESNEAQEAAKEKQINFASVAEPMTAFKTTYYEFKRHSDSFNTYYFPLTIAALLIIPFAYRRKVFLAIPFFAAVVFAIPFVINLIDMHIIQVIRSTGVQLIFQVFAVSVAAAGAFFIHKIKLDKKRAIALIALMIAVLLYATYATYTVFSQKSSTFPVVNEHDTAAFEWINDNVDEEAVFLNNALQSTRRKKIIFSKDAGAWLPVYTGNPVTMPFHGGRFFYQETHDNYSVYLQLENNFPAAVCKLEEMDVDYYYHDLETPYGAPFNVIESSQNEVFERVYGNPGAEIYEINHDKLCP